MAKQKESDVDKWARLKKLRLASQKSSASAKEDVRDERDAAWAKKESNRAELQQKHQVTLKTLHPDICERTHPLIGHSAWSHIVIQLGFKFESTKGLSRCVNCSSAIPPGENSWVMNKRIRQNNGRRSKQKFKNHYCQKCGLPLLLPEPSKSNKKN
ncbi:hypothetical protein JYU04_02205 [Dehalococcoides mccartyi]|nr:hypothetical protein [Dehalococcoides mccartyi]